MGGVALNSRVNHILFQAPGVIIDLPSSILCICGCTRGSGS